MPPDPDELLQQADTLASNPSATQADLRRAISAAYYALFHLSLIAAADFAQGCMALSSEEYALVYRSVDHARLRGVCKQLGTKQELIKLPEGFGKVADFASIVVTLHEQRTLADYDPSQTYTAIKAKLLISDAREAVKWFRASTAEQQRAFLIMLLFKARQNQA